MLAIPHRFGSEPQFSLSQSTLRLSGERYDLANKAELRGTIFDSTQANTSSRKEQASDKEKL